LAGLCSSRKHELELFVWHYKLEASPWGVPCFSSPVKVYCPAGNGNLYQATQRFVFLILWVIPVCTISVSYVFHLFQSVEIDALVLLWSSRVLEVAYTNFHSTLMLIICWHHLVRTLSQSCLFVETNSKHSFGCFSC
jgi:hypothetical protein